MKKNNYNSVSDFLNDKSFVDWIQENSLTDTSFWEYWLANNPEKKELANAAKDVVLGIQFKKATLSQEKISSEWNIFEKKLATSKLFNPKKQKRNYLKHTSLAASLLLFIAVGGYLLSTNFSKVTHKTAYGEFLNLTLQDGSKVTLNSNSSISYYKNNSRKVWLNGEAFFEVDKKETTHAKFWVLTNDLSVEVFGTSFNVNSKHQKTEVFLEEGSIWLALKNGINKKMIPTNFISYSSKENIVLEEYNLENSKLKTSWKSGTIVFDKLPLIEAFKKIEDTYGVTAIFKDEKSKSKLITGAVPITNLTICIKAIEKSVGVQIIRKKNQLIIQNK